MLIVPPYLRSAPAASGGGGGESLPLLFQDDFESGGLTHTENGIEWGSGASTAVSNQNSNGGTYSLKFTFASGADSWSERRFDLGTARNEYIITYDLYIPDGTESYGGAAYTHRSDGATNNKFLRMWRGDKSDGNDGYGTVYQKHGASFTRNVTGVNLSRVIQEYGNQSGVGQFGSTGSGTDAQDADGYITTNDRGTWIAVKHRVKAASSANNDGIIETWKNGSIFCSVYNLPSYPSGGESQRGFDFGYLLGYANSGFDATTYMFIDNVKIYGA